MHRQYVQDVPPPPSVMPRNEVKRERKLTEQTKKWLMTAAKERTIKGG